MRTFLYIDSKLTGKQLLNISSLMGTGLSIFLVTKNKSSNEPLSSFAFRRNSTALMLTFNVHFIY